LKNLRASILKDEFGKIVIHLDIKDYDSLVTLFKKTSYSTIIHLAAQAGIRIPMSGASSYIDSNLVGFSNVASLAAVMGVPHILYASSSSVYGNKTPPPYKENYYPLIPLSFYGATKLSNEILAESIAYNSNSRFTGLRFFTAYGPYGRPDMAYFRIATSIIQNQLFELYGDGSVKRDFTYVDDLLEALFKIMNFRLNSGGSSHEIYNIGGGSPHSILELIETFESISGKKLKLTFRQKIKSDVDMTIADGSKLLRDTGFKPKISLNQGISEFLAWAQSSEIRTHLSDWVKA
jgi:UDP-glucuronate 4-epimerase